MLLLEKELPQAAEARQREILVEMAGVWEHKLQNHFEALDAYRRVLTRWPDDAEARAAVERLQRRPSQIADLDDTALAELGLLDDGEPPVFDDEPEEAEPEEAEPEELEPEELEPEDFEPEDVDTNPRQGRTAPRLGPGQRPLPPPRVGPRPPVPPIAPVARVAAPPPLPPPRIATADIDFMDVAEPPPRRPPAPPPSPPQPPAQHPPPAAPPPAPQPRPRTAPAAAQAVDVNLDDVLGDDQVEEVDSLMLELDPELTERTAPRPPAPQPVPARRSNGRPSKPPPLPRK
jgi:hypothetical protein